MEFLIGSKSSEIKPLDRIRKEMTKEIMKISGCCKYNLAHMESLGTKYASRKGKAADEEEEDGPKKAWDMYQIIEEVK